MCRAQQLQCNSESSPQLIGAHQSHQACSEHTHAHCFESTVTTRGRGAQQLGQLSHTVIPRNLGTGALFLISESGRGEGAQLLASRLDYMEFEMQATIEWKRGHIWDILATVQPHSFGLGISAPPCFRVLFGKVQQCCISHDQTTGDLKSHHLQAGVTALSVPPSPPFFQQYMKKVFLLFFKGTHGLFGGGGGGGGGTCMMPASHWSRIYTIKNFPFFHH